MFAQFLLNPLSQHKGVHIHTIKAQGGLKLQLQPFLPSLLDHAGLIKRRVKLHSLNVDHLLVDVFSLQKNFQSSVDPVVEAVIVPRTEPRALDWLQLT